MKPRFSEGEMVRVFKNGKSLFEGKVVCADRNMLTFRWEYDIEHYDADRNDMWTTICVPEENIERI